MSENKPKDKWEKLDIISKALLSLAGLAFTILFTSLQTKTQKLENKRQEYNRRYETSAQLFNQREQSEMDFRQRIFDALLTKVMNHKIPICDRIAVLRLFQHNFHDIFNGRSFFDLLETEVTTNTHLCDSVKSKLVNDLVSIAREATGRQEAVIESNQEKKVIYKVEPSTSCVKGTQFPIFIAKEKDTINVELNCEGITGTQHVARVILDSILNENAVQVQVKFKDDNEGLPPFIVGYYDTPYTDNILLPDGHRFSLILKNVNRDLKTAKFKILEFPHDLIIAGFRPSIKMVNKIMEGEE
ncbi:MAG TPA: hypothetical protein VGQ09_09235 [Chitinophagaceae bacterium]|jgi:hypothetical protein|nr:hypothetical protein [Chitinophagaceae bacterium]